MELLTTHTRRSGLPRVSGGTPWPPPRSGSTPAAAPAAAPETLSATAAETVPASVSAAVPEAAAAAAPSTVTAPAPAALAALTTPATELGANTVLQRRGLPRTVGGEPWPPRRAVPIAPAAAVAPVVPVAVAPPTPVAAPTTVAAPERRRYRGRTLPQWAGLGALVGAALLLVGALAALFTQWLLGTEPLQNFLADYPGEYDLPEGAPVGLPWWLRWAHFFNVFLIVLIIRTGLQTRSETRPTVFWSPTWNPTRKISLTIWLHQSLDLLWVLNGTVFVVLLFATGQWVRIIPTSWEVFPNALSAALQYVSLDWPTENGWVNYNGLQQLTYFATVFIAAPLAAATGVRLSGLWPKGATRLNRIYPIELARAVHFPVMLYFVVFIFFHVTLVLATGALRNLNHMFAGQDVVNWTGLGIFAASLLVVAGGLVAARPLVVAPIAALFGRVGR